MAARAFEVQRAQDARPRARQCWVVGGRRAYLRWMREATRLRSPVEAMTPVEAMGVRRSSFEIGLPSRCRSKKFAQVPRHLEKISSYGVDSKSGNCPVDCPVDSGLSTSLWTVQWTVQWTVLLCGPLRTLICW